MTTKITKAHLLGLELAREDLNMHASGEVIAILSSLIAQAKAAPDDEPVAWTWQGTLDRLANGYCPDGEAVWPHKKPGAQIPLYTHTQPERGGVPDGYVLVPLDPVRFLDMGFAYVDAAREACPEKKWAFSIPGYKAMLAAAQEKKS